MKPAKISLCLSIAILLAAAADASAQVVPRHLILSAPSQPGSASGSAGSQSSAQAGLGSGITIAPEDSLDQILPIDKELDCNMPDAPDEVTLSPAYVEKVALDDKGECFADIVKVSAGGSLDYWTVVLPYTEKHGRAMCDLLYSAVNRDFASETIIGYLEVRGRECKRPAGDGKYEPKQYLRHVSYIAINKNLNMKEMNFSLSSKIDSILKTLYSLMSFLNAPY